jgi:hypothetical protein
MNEQVIAYLNANIHKIAKFNVMEYYIFVEFINGDEVKIHAEREDGRLIVELLTK